MITNTTALMFTLGWQGGTIHQVSEVLNVSPQFIIEANYIEMNVLLRQAQRIRNMEFANAK